MKIGQVMGVGLLISASLASFGNFLWLIGILPEPNSHLMEARWIYSACVSLIGMGLITASSIEN